MIALPRLPRGSALPGVPEWRMARASATSFPVGVLYPKRAAGGPVRAILARTRTISLALIGLSASLSSVQAPRP
jgi:hypothetical protein